MRKEFYTVAEFAALCNISKQAVYQKLNTTLKDFVKVENGKKLISAKALPPDFKKQIFNALVKDIERQYPIVEEDKQSDFTAFLMAQIEEKDKQIEALQKEVSETNKTIANLTVELTEITKQAQELNRNNQILLLNQNNNTAIEGGEPIAAKETTQGARRTFRSIFKHK